MTSPEAAPEPEVLRTPRSGNLLTFRVGLALDPEAAGGWFAPLSPRAQANAAFNHWLVSQLPEPQAIQWTVQISGQPATVHSLSDLRLEPLDLVLMSGDRLGDQSSELERYFIRHHRWQQAIPSSISTVIAPAEPGSDSGVSVRFHWGAASNGNATLASVQPLLARWRRMVTQSRAMHAGDWRRTAAPQGADAEDPTGSATGDPRLIQFTDLTGRLDVAIEALTLLAERVGNAANALIASAANMESDPGVLEDPNVVANVQALLEALFALEQCGLPEATPAESLPLSPELIRNLLLQAETVLGVVENRKRRATELRQNSFPGPVPPAEPAHTNELARRHSVQRQNYLEAAKTLFGPTFTIIPLYRLPSDQAAVIQLAAANPPVSDASAVEEWLHSNSRVRPRIADVVIGMATARWLGHPLEYPKVLQLPHQPGQAWIGGRLESPLPATNWLSVVLWNMPLLSEPVQAGLVIDDWTETIPAARETTGVAFHYNRPNAIAPQAILVALPSRQLGRWSWDELLGSVNEALDLAKIRAVEPDALIGSSPDTRPPEGAYFQLLPAILTEMTRTRFAFTDFASAVVAGAVQSNP